MADYTLPTTPVSGEIDSYDLPQYVGELFDLNPGNAVFFSMAGGMNGGRTVASREFTWSVDGAEASSSGDSQLENQDPTATAVPVQQVTNVVEIHQEAVEFGYTAQAVIEQLATDSTLILGDQPVKSPMQHQIDKKINKIKRDLNKSWLLGSLVNPTDNLTARETQGILGAITTHARDYTVSTDASLRDSLNALLVSMFEPTNEEAVAPAVNEDGTLVLFCGGSVKVQLSNDYTNSGLLAPRDRTMGGVAVDTLVTDFGLISIVMDRHMPAATALLADMSVIKPAILPIPGKGLFFAEPLAKTGAVDKVQIYGEIGLQYGPESFHGKITAIT